MPDEYLTRHEHNEFAKRMEEANQRIVDENKRQNERLKTIDGRLDKIQELIISIQQIATNVKSLTEEMQRQGGRLEALEAKPGKRWEAIVDKVLMLIVGGVVGYVLLKLGIGG